MFFGPLTNKKNIVFFACQLNNLTLKYSPSDRNLIPLFD